MKAKEFGQFIRELRKNKNLTIRQLELYSGVSNSYLSLLENGKRGIPSPEILKKLSKPLNIEYEELMKKAGYWEQPLPEDWQWITLSVGAISEKKSGMYKPFLMSIFEMLENFNYNNSVDPDYVNAVVKEAEKINYKVNPKRLMENPTTATKEILKELVNIPDAKNDENEKEDQNDEVLDYINMTKSDIKRSLIEEVLKLSDEDAEYVADLIRRLRKSDTD